MPDNFPARDASGALLQLRTKEVSSNIHTPYHRLEGFSINGPAAQSALNTDLLTGVVNGWYEAGDFFSGTIQIIASAGITAGAIIFEQTNDNTSTVGISLPAQEVSLINTNPTVASVTIAASTRRAWQIPITMRFIRVRVSTAFVGGTVQALATFSQQPYAYPAMNVQQASASALLVTTTPTTPTTTNINSAATTNATLIKGSAGTIYGITASNIAGAARFLKIYSKATAPIPGTDIPILTIPIPAGQVVSPNFGELGWRVSLGIGIAITAAAQDSDVTAIGASEVKVNVSFI